MSNTTRWPYDVPVEGVSERYLTMPELMACYESCMASHDYEGAKSVLEYSVDCAYLPAKLTLARLLRNTPQLRIPQNERYALSEKLYRQILNTMDLPDRVIASVAVELASLYETLNRPLACLGWLLTAKRYGYQVQDKDLEICQKKLNRMDINSFGNHPQDCYDLGSELWMAGEFKYAELFLQEACASTDKALAGRSYLALANLYDEHRSESHIYRSEAAKCYQKAKENGFAEYLTQKPRGAEGTPSSSRAV